jgi:hypothetical protein
MRAAVALFLLLAACTGAPEIGVVPMPAVDKSPPWIATSPPPPAIASYKIEAILDVEAHRVRGRQTLTWVNSGKSAVNELPFHLYMNAFKNEDTVFMMESRGTMRGARADHDSWGWIEVNAVSVDGTDASAAVRYPGPDETVMEVPLTRPLAPGGKVEVAMMYEVQLPVVFARTGYRDDFHMIGQWFPKIGVRVERDGKEQWHCETFHLASEFFADFGSYDVLLTVPDTHVIAATGVLVEAKDNQDDTRLLRYKAEGVHDFVWMADPFMESISAPARTDSGPVEVRIYYRPDQADFAPRHLAAAKASIEGFSKMLVPYPWARMIVVDPPPSAVAGAGGMEYPTLVTTAGDSVFTPDGVRLPEMVTIHEVGHNWFQGILASNEVDEAWLDEGMNEYIDGVLMDRLYGEEYSGVDWGPFYAGIGAGGGGGGGPGGGGPPPRARFAATRTRSPSAPSSSSTTRATGRPTTRGPRRCCPRWRTRSAARGSSPPSRSTRPRWRTSTRPRPTWSGSSSASSVRSSTGSSGRRCTAPAPPISACAS